MDLVAHYSRVDRPFRTWTLSKQFAVAGGVVMLAAATFAGLLISMIVSKTTVEETAAATALFMDNFLSSHVQSLATAEVLPTEVKTALDKLLESDAFENRFPHLEIWKPNGLIVYSTSDELIGRRFPAPPGTITAFNGQVTAQYADLNAQEHTERSFQHKYLEIYSPVRDQNTGQIIAVVEIHELPELIREKLFFVQLYTWLITGGITFLVMASLFGIVYRGSKIIQTQQERLKKNISEVQEISDQNLILRQRSQTASSRLAELNAKYLRNVGAELHDGPAQLIGLAVLKIEHIHRAVSDVERARELASLELVLGDALRDIRVISKGLMLPKIEDMSLCAVINVVVRAHEQRTKTRVKISCHCNNVQVSHAVKICVYRFVQEGLYNAFKHAGGVEQYVSCDYQDENLVLKVSDKGISNNNKLKIDEMGLGLMGMRDRVESLGGTVEIYRTETGNTTLRMELGLTERGA